MKKRPDLLVPIAIWEFLTALGVLIPITAIISLFFFAAPGVWVWGDDWGMPGAAGFFVAFMTIIILIMVVYFILALLGGIWLLQGRERGRILSIVHAALSVFWIPVGTVIGILVLLYLVRHEVQEYVT